MLMFATLVWCSTVHGRRIVRAYFSGFVMRMSVEIIDTFTVHSCNMVALRLGALRVAYNFACCTRIPRRGGM